MLDIIQSANSDYAKFSLQSIFAAMGVSVVVSVTVFIGFCILRPRHRVIYEPRRKALDPNDDRAPPSIPSGLLAWIKPLWAAREDDLVRKLGLDAIVFLRFWRMCLQMMTVFTGLGCVILVPINYVGWKQSTAVAGASVNFSDLSITSVKGSLVTAHIVFAWIFTLVVLALLYVNHRKVTQLRTIYFQSHEYLRQLHSRTLWIQFLRPEWRSDRALGEVAMNLERARPFSDAHVGRKIDGLPELALSIFKAMSIYGNCIRGRSGFNSCGLNGAPIELWAR